MSTLQIITQLKKNVLHFTYITLKTVHTLHYITLHILSAAIAAGVYWS